MFYALLRAGRSVLRRCRVPRYGPLALIVVFRPYLIFLGSLLPALVGWWRSKLLRWALCLAALSAVGRYMYRQRHRPRALNTTQFKVMSWNMLFVNPYVEAALSFLATAPADVIAIQELTADHVARIKNDATLARLYPYQLLWSYGIGAGMGLLSKYPIVEHGDLRLPPAIWACLEVAEGQRFVILSAHPTFYPTRMAEEKREKQRTLWQKINRLLDLRLLTYDPDHRDDGIEQVRKLIDGLVQRDEPLLVVGDFNVTEREPAYGVLTAGLHDAFRAAGVGIGLTWGPEWMARLPLAVLRIDYMVHSAGIRPLRMSVDHTPRGSDHSPIFGAFEFDEQR